MSVHKLFKQKKSKSYELEIKIKIKGYVPIPTSDNGNFPDLPLTYLEYIQDITNKYSDLYEKAGYFVVVSFNKKEVLP